MTGSALLFWLLLAAVVLGVAWAASGRRNRVPAGGPNQGNNNASNNGNQGKKQVDQRLHEFADELTTRARPEAPDPEYVQARLGAPPARAGTLPPDTAPTVVAREANQYTDGQTAGNDMTDAVRIAPADVEHTMAAYADLTGDNQGGTRSAGRTGFGGAGNEFADELTAGTRGGAGASTQVTHRAGKTDYGRNEFGDDLTGSGDPAELPDTQYGRDRLAGTTRGAAYTFTQSSLAAERSREVMAAANEASARAAGRTDRVTPRARDVDREVMSLLNDVDVDGPRQTTIGDTRERDDDFAVRWGEGTGGPEVGGGLGSALEGTKRSRTSGSRARGPGITEPTTAQMKQARKDQNRSRGTDPI